MKRLAEWVDRADAMYAIYECAGLEAGATVRVPGRTSEDAMRLARMRADNTTHALKGLFPVPTEAERFALSYRERKSADLVVNDFAAMKPCPNLKASKLPGCNPGRPDGWSVDASAALPGFTSSTAPSRGLKMKGCWQIFPRCLLASLAVLLAPTTWACNPIRTIGIVFERNSATVPSKEVLKLANWTAMLRLQYPNRESLFLSTQAAFGEHDASNLGVKRARNVARVLREDLQFDVREVDLPTKGYVAAIPAPEGSDLVKRVNIDFLPACPHECPCQKGDPLYKPPALQR